jgi:membrane-associated phospholipid phosphatase
MSSPGKRWWISAIALALGFVALAILVRLGLLNTFDDRIRQLARPDDVWGTAQKRADVVVEGLRPPVLVISMAILTLVWCLIRRSVLPAVIGAAGLVLAAASTLATKLAVGRADPHGYLAQHGGSFPSGHVLTLMVSVGLAVLMVHPQGSGWILFVPAALAGAVMGGCLLLQSAHWTTDVIGGALLAGGALATVRGGLATFGSGSRERHSLRSPPAAATARPTAGDTSIGGSPHS